MYSHLGKALLITDASTWGKDLQKLASCDVRQSYLAFQLTGLDSFSMRLVKC